MKKFVTPALVTIALLTFSACSEYNPSAKEKAALMDDTPVSQPNGMQQADPYSGGSPAPAN